MKKQKTREEFEEGWYWLKFSIVIIILFLIILLTILIFPSSQYKYRELEQQLSKCQEQAPVWTLRVECKYPLIDFYHYSEKNYTNYNEYLEGKERVIKFENCEVLE